MTDNRKITSEEIKKAVETSGYPFELEIARKIESHGYFVTPNYNFEDHDTGRSREIDLHAITAETVSMRRVEFLFAVLLGSCKANKVPYVFFTRDNPLSSIILEVDAPLSGMPLKIISPEGEWEPAADFFKLHKILHIATAQTISSQFCQVSRGTSNKKEWNISQETIVESVVVPLVKALAREIEDHNEMSKPHKEEGGSYYQIYYPVLILKGPLFEYYVPYEGPPQVRQSEHVVLVRHYQSRVLKGEYAIDVIHEGFLDTYLEISDKEVKALVNRIRRHRKRVLESIKKLAA